MKTASSATLAILAAGQYLKIEFYKFTLPRINSSFYFHTGDAGGPITVGGQAYLSGLTMVRSSLSQSIGLETQSFDLTIEPQDDNPGGIVTVGGTSFMSACRQGFFDSGIVLMSKGFFNAPASGVQLDTSPGIVPWFQGIVDELRVGRFSVDMTINDTSQMLNVQMPKNILQSGCVHTLNDGGCGLLTTDNAYAGTVTGTPTARSINASALTQADGFFNLGIIKFTSGVLSGSSYTVSTFTAATDLVVPIAPWATTPAAGDTFTIQPGCDKLQATCTSAKFKIGASFATNLPRFRGYPYVPQPETLFDGGTPASTAPSIGGQRGQGAGSNFSGQLGKGSYGS